MTGCTNSTIWIGFDVQLKNDFDFDFDDRNISNNKWLLKFSVDMCNVMHVGHSMATQYVMEQDGQSWNFLKLLKRRISVLLCPAI